MAYDYNLLENADKLEHLAPTSRILQAEKTPVLNNLRGVLRNKVSLSRRQQIFHRKHVTVASIKIKPSHEYDLGQII